MAAKRKDISDDQLREHFNRWLIIRNRIPIGFVASLQKKNPSWKKSTINNVAYGRAWDFEILAALEDLVVAYRSRILRRHNLVCAI